MRIKIYASRPQGPGFDPTRCHPPLQVCVAHGVTGIDSSWAEPRAVAWGLRILDKGRLGIKMPHGPGDCSFVAQIFMHTPLRHLRRWRSGVCIKICATKLQSPGPCGIFMPNLPLSRILSPQATALGSAQLESIPVTPWATQTCSGGWHLVGSNPGPCGLDA